MTSGIIYSKTSDDTELLKLVLEKLFHTLFLGEWKNCKNCYPFWIDLNSMTDDNEVWWCLLIPVPWVNAAFSGYSFLNLPLLTLFPHRGVCSGSSEIWSGYTHGSWHLVSVSRFIWATGTYDLSRHWTDRSSGRGNSALQLGWGPEAEGLSRFISTSSPANCWVSLQLSEPLLCILLISWKLECRTNGRLALLWENLCIKIALTVLRKCCAMKASLDCIEVCCHSYWESPQRRP